MTIPADILKAATDLMLNTKGDYFDFRDDIARAIMEERERCARLAREYPLTDIYEAHSNRAVAFNASQNIADTIEGKLTAIRSSHHTSDCALHNEPAFPAGPCDCGAIASAIRNEGAGE